MSPKTIQFRLGIGACLLAMLLAFIGIPYWVSSPSNVSNIVLSPIFWPNVLTSLLGLSGLGLILVSRVADTTVDESADHPSDGHSWIRLVALGFIMVITMFALPRIGMVWTTMLVFLVTAFLFKTRHPIIALVCAVLVPLGLYAFFAHVAGVAIPQGNYVRLP